MSLFDIILSKINISNTKEKVLKNLYWATIGKIVTLLGGLFVGILVARYLGPEQYGLMNYVISYVSIFQIFASFGMDNIEIRELSKDGANTNLIIGTVFCIKLILSLITLVLIFITSLLFESDIFTICMILLYSFSIILNCFNVIRNYFTSIVYNEYIVKTEIFRTIIGVGIKILLLILKMSLWTFIAAYVFDFVLLSSGYVLVYKKKIGSLKLWNFDSKLALYFLKQSFPLLLSGAAVIIYQRVDQVMLGSMIDNIAVAQFSVASKFVEMLIFVPMTFSQTIAPVLVKTKSIHKEEYIQKSQYIMDLTFWGSIILAILVFLSARWLVLLTFGESYVGAVKILKILSFKVVVVALSTIAGKMIVIDNMQKYSVFRDILGLCVCVICNLLIIPQYGPVGAAYVAIISNFFAGYVSSLIIPQYRKIFIMQTKTIFLGWKTFFNQKR